MISDLEKYICIAWYYLRRDVRRAKRGLPPASKQTPEAEAIYDTFHLTNDVKKARINHRLLSHTDDDDEVEFDGILGRWRTMNGSPVFIASADGRIVAGCGGKFNGFTMQEAIEAAKGKITTPSNKMTYVWDEFGTQLRYKNVGHAGKPFTFAGKGSKTKLRVEPRLIRDYGGTAGSWSHTRQKRVVDIGNGVTKTADVHWHYEPTVGYVEQRIVKWF